MLTWIAVFYGGSVGLGMVPLAFDTKAQCERTLVQYQDKGWLILYGAKVKCTKM